MLASFVRVGLFLRPEGFPADATLESRRMFKLMGKEILLCFKMLAACLTLKIRHHCLLNNARLSLEQSPGPIQHLMRLASSAPRPQGVPEGTPRGVRRRALTRLASELRAHPIIFSLWVRRRLIKITRPEINRKKNRKELSESFSQHLRISKPFFKSE